MKSLRTDDILGAVPKVRHMPKTILRQKQLQASNSLQGSFNSLDSPGNLNRSGGKWDQSYYNDNLNGNFPLSQYDPNPFIKQASVNRQQRKVSPPNYHRDKHDYHSVENMYQHYSKQLPPPPPNQPLQIQAPSSPRASDRYRIETQQVSYKYPNPEKQLEKSDVSPQKYIRPKQMAYVNYDQVRQAERLQQIRSQSELGQYSDLKQQEIHSPSENQAVSLMKKTSGQEENSPLRKSVTFIENTPSSPREQPRKKEERGSIFRGLGFNIITNSKYSYNLETADRSPKP